MIKIVPKNDNFEPFLAQNISFENNLLTIKIKKDLFSKSLQNNDFTIILEENTKIKFFHAQLTSKNQNTATFKILDQNEIFKRSYDRLPLKYLITGDIATETTNISAGGMQFLTEQPLIQNKPLNLQIDLNGQKIKVEFLPLRVEPSQKNAGQSVVSGKFLNLDSKIKSIILQEGLKYKLSLKGEKNE